MNKQKIRAVILLPMIAHIFVILSLVSTLIRGWEPKKLGFVLLNYSFDNYLLHAFKCARHETNSLLLKCIRKEGKNVGGGRFKSSGQKKLRNYLSGLSLTWTFSVSREVAALILDYTGVTSYLCALMFRTGACLPRYAGQRERQENHFSSASSGEVILLAFI